MAQDFYTTLGLTRTATDDQIKKAFRKLALRYHPDKQTQKNATEQKDAEEMFQKITNAYEVLSDKDKKRVYDQYGEAGLEGGMPMGGNSNPSGGPGGFSSGGGGTQFFFSSGGRGGFSDPRDVFARFFGGGMGAAEDDDDDEDDPFAAMFSRAGARGKPQARPTAAKRPTPAKKPDPVIHTINLSLEEMYNGCTKKLKITRNHGGRNDTKVLEVQVRPGWKAGTKVTYENDGDQDPKTGLFADIVFVIQEKPHPTYKRVGNDILVKVPITLTDALCGVKKSFTHLDGTQVEVDTSNTIITPDNNKKFVFGRGFPSKQGPGNFVVEFNVLYPGSLTQEQKRLLREVKM